MPTEKGQRVGAIMSVETSTCNLFGYGIYLGNEIPPPEIGCMGVSLAQLGRENPKILLDDGKVVWGCECWWGPEEQIKAMIEKKQLKVVMVDIEEARKESYDERAATSS